MKKRLLYILLFVALAIIGYFITLSQFPKSASRYPFFIFLFLVDIYVWFSAGYLVRKMRKPARIGVGIIYWMPAFLMVASVVMSSFYPMTQWPHWISAYLFGVVFVFYFSKLIALIFILLSDIIRFSIFILLKTISAISKKQDKAEKVAMTRGTFLKTVGLASGGVILGTFVTGMIKWVHDFQVKQINLSFPNLPKAFDGLRIVQVSDIHLGSFPSINILNEAIELINNQNPDYVFFTGDLVNSVTDEAYRFKDSLKAIQAKNGTYSILGNHDYGDYVSWDTPEEKAKNMQALYDLFNELGWKLLDNENEIWVRGEDRIALLGVQNWSSNPRFPKHGDIDKSLEGTEGIPFKILLSHDPTHWENMISKDYPDIDLTLSGHTHGMQMGFEFKNFRWSPAQYIYKYWAGLYSTLHGDREQYLYVNRGLGVIGYMGRVGILPEITLITLESK